MKTLGKIAGGVGLLLSLTSILTLFVTSGSLTIFLVKLGLGVAMLVFWGVTNGRSSSLWAQSAFFYSSSVIITAVFLAFLAAANFIVAKRSKTWDLTRNKIFSLAPQTDTALKDLKDPVKAIAFIEGPIPDSVENLFQRYQAVNEKFTYEFKDPQRSPDLTAKYEVRQGQPAAVLVRQGAQESHTTVNLSRLANPQTGEQELTNGLIKLNTVGTQKLYFVVGHGEWPLEPPGQGEEAQMASLANLGRVLQDEGYAPEPLNLVERGEIPRDASALVIAGAHSKLSEPEKKLLEAFLAEGGRLFLLVDVGVELGLDELLAKYGVQIDPGMVADSRVNPDQPFLIITPFFGEHDITRPLLRAKANVLFPMSRALTVLQTDTLPDVKALPLVITTPNAWLESTLSDQPTLDSGEKSGQLPIATVSTRNTAGVENKRSNEARLVIFGASQSAVGGFAIEGNRNLIMNTFAWVTTQTQRITIRPPDRDLSTVDLTPDMLSTIRLLSMDVLPMLLISVGLTIWLTRRAR